MKAPNITLQITATPRLNRWQIGSRILAALIVATLFFGVGALWERHRQSKLPRVYFRVQTVAVPAPVKPEIFTF